MEFPTMKFRWVLISQQSEGRSQIFACGKQTHDNPYEAIRCFKEKDVIINASPALQLVLHVESAIDYKHCLLEQKHPLLEFRWGKCIRFSPASTRFLSIFANSQRSFSSIRECLEDLERADKQRDTVPDAPLSDIIFIKNSFSDFC